jgi:hypothetical protein
MQTHYWLGLAALMSLPGALQAQARPVERPVRETPTWGVQPIPPVLALSRGYHADATSQRPFYLPRPGEHTAYWVGFGAGLVISPLLWCEGCSTVSNATTSLLLGLGGAVTGLLLQRAF